MKLKSIKFSIYFDLVHFEIDIFENFRPKFKSIDLSPDLSDCWGVLDEDVLGLRTYKGWGRTWVHFEVKRVRSRWKWIVRTSSQNRNIRFGVSCYKWSYWLTVHVIVRSLYRLNLLNSSNIRFVRTSNP